MSMLVLAIFLVGSANKENSIDSLDHNNRATHQDNTIYRIPFTLQQNKIILPLKIGNSRPLMVILDTGMAFEGLFLYKRELIRELGISDSTIYTIGGAGNQPPSTAVTKDSMIFSIAKKVFTNQRIIILNNDRFEGFPSDGVVGYSLFGRHDVHIDYDLSQITLHAPGTMLPDKTWASIPLYFKDNFIPWIDASLGIRGDEDVSVAMYIDLASGEGIELLLRDDMKFTLPENLTDSYLGRGVSGDIYGYVGIIERLCLGPYTLRRVKAAFAPAKVRSKQQNADGVLGNNALRRFNLIFSYATKILYLKPNTFYQKPFE